MPELPEVETIRKGLETYLVGKKIESVEIKLAKQFSGEKHKIENQKITKVDRFGKGLVIEFANNYCLAIHIKLTGQLVYRGEDEPKHIASKAKVGKLPNKWTHVIFHLDHSATLFYNFSTTTRTFLPFFSIHKCMILIVSFFPKCIHIG